MQPVTKTTKQQRYSSKCWMTTAHLNINYETLTKEQLQLVKEKEEMIRSEIDRLSKSYNVSDINVINRDKFPISETFFQVDGKIVGDRIFVNWEKNIVYSRYL